jgi:hypothetical protein
LDNCQKVEKSISNEIVAVQIRLDTVKKAIDVSKAKVEAETKANAEAEKKADAFMK